MSWVGIGVGVIGAAGSAIGAGAASDAAQQQADAARNAQNISQNEFNTITQQEAPFLQGGYGAQSQLNYLLGNGTAGSGGTAASSPAGGFGSLLTPFNADTFKTMSPAYQFQLQQGGQGVLNGNAAGQGALSGSAMKDLIGYNQSYANTAYNNAFNQYQSQQNNVYNRLSGVAQLGQNAASNTGEQGTALAGQAAQSATNVGTALAGGTVGSANAISGGLSSVALPWLLNNQGSGSSGVPADSQDITGSGDY